MINHTAECIDATDANAGIHALGVHTRFIRCAVTVENALGSTAQIRITKVTFAADAAQPSTLTLAVRIRSAL